MNAEPTILKETDKPKYVTNDIKLTAALITAGHEIVEVKHRENPRNRKKEILFCFECTEHQNQSTMSYLSGSLTVDARSILDNRDCLLSYVSNGSRELLENLNSKKHAT